MAELAVSALEWPYFWHVFWCISIFFVSVILMVPPAMSLLIHIQRSKWAVLITFELLVSVIIIERTFFQTEIMPAFWTISLAASVVLSLFQLIWFHCILIRRDKHGKKGGHGGWTKKRFLAFSLSRRCMAIVKIPLDDYIKRFERERLAVNRVTRGSNNPEHIGDGKRFLVMRRINGVDLYTWARETMKDAAIEQLGYALAQVGIGSCNGLRALYPVGVVAYRDISPDNIFVRIDGEMLTAIVIDYGMVKVTDEFDEAIPPSNRPEGTPAVYELKHFFGRHKAAINMVESDDVRSLARTLAFPLIERYLLSSKGSGYENIVENGEISLVALEKHVKEPGNFERILRDAVRPDGLCEVLLNAENEKYAKSESPMGAFQSVLEAIPTETQAETETPQLVTPVLVSGDHSMSANVIQKEHDIPESGTPEKPRQRTESNAPYNHPASDRWLGRMLAIFVSIVLVFPSVFVLMCFANGKAQYSPVELALVEEESGDESQEIGDQDNSPITEDPPGEVNEELPDVGIEAEKIPDVAQEEGTEQEPERPQLEPWKLVLADAGEYDSVKVSYRQDEYDPEKKDQRWEYEIPDDVNTVEVRYRGYSIHITKSAAGTHYLGNSFRNLLKNKDRDNP